VVDEDEEGASAGDEKEEEEEKERGPPLDTVDELEEKAAPRGVCNEA
jgi:hypothetical protein